MKTSKPVVALMLVGLVSCVGPADPPEPAEAPEAEGTELSASERALDELSAAYEELTGLLDEGSGQAVDRVQEDIENLGDWEYRIVELPNDSADSIAAQLNAFGDDRWEAYWVEPSGEVVRIYLKRPSASYLGRVPLTALIRLLAAGA